MKRIIITIFVIILILVLSPLNKKQIIEEKDITKFRINSTEYNLKRKQKLSINAWNNIEIKYNDKNYTEMPVIAKNITIGSTYKEVIKAFQIQKGYAAIDMEIDSKYEDGTTDIRKTTYRDEKIFKKEYLDLELLFGYKKVDNKWVMLKANQVKRKMKSNEELLIFKIDFNGMSGEIVQTGEVISIEIIHQ